MIKIDVRGLSCPEPVMQTIDALKENPGEDIVVLCDEAHSRKNIETALKYHNKECTVQEKNGEFEISFKA